MRLAQSFSRSTAGVLLAAFLFPAAGHAGGYSGFLEVYREAAQADPRLRGQELELRALSEDRREQFGALLPSVTLTGDVNRTRRDQTSSGMAGEEEIRRTFTREHYAVELVQPLFDLPAWYGHRRSETQVDEGRAQVEGARQELVMNVAAGYLGMLSAQSDLELRERELEAIEARFDRVEALFDEGMAAITDVEELRAERDSARAAIVRAEGQLQIARERLAEVTGTRYRQLAGLRPDAELPAPDPDDPSHWVETALAHSPEIQALHHQMEGLQLEGRQTRAQGYPSVRLVAGYSRMDELDGTQFGRRFDDAALGVEVRVPLYQGGSVRAGTNAAGYRRDRALESLEEARRGVTADVRAAYEGILSGRSQISAFRQAVRSGERSVEAMEAGVEEGRRTAADLIDAQRDLFESRRDLAQSRYEYLENMIALQVHAGLIDDDEVRDLDRLFVGAEPASNP